MPAKLKLTPWKRSYVHRVRRLRNKLTTKAVCARLGISEATFYSAFRAGKLFPAKGGTP